jgi:thymidylate synthase (FAD)
LSLPPNLLHFYETPTPVLDQGFVRLLDVMGNDHDVVRAARMSYGKGTRKVSKDEHLLRYLLRHGHLSPFEMCEIKVLVRVPMDAWRQWIRHRTASVNEYSTRYSEAIDATQCASEWRAQASDNKQGSRGLVTEWSEGFLCSMDLNGSFNKAEIGEIEAAGPQAYLSRREQELQSLSREVYLERLALGVAREQARKDIPLCTYTEAVWKIDLRNLLHFLELRMDSHAQYEIRQYAEALAKIVKAWVPWTWKAFEDYRLHALHLSRGEVQALKLILSRLTGEGCQADKVIQSASDVVVLSGREKTEMIAKLARLFDAEA